MFFRNLTLFRFAPGVLGDAITDHGLSCGDRVNLDLRLGDHPLKPVGPLELSSRGFVSPFGRDNDQMVLTQSHYALVTLGGLDKILPAAVVNQALADKVAAYHTLIGRRPTGRERKRLKDDVLTDLLPRAFARPWRLNGYFDVPNGWLVIDTTSRRAGEGFVSALREAFGSFPALPVNAESSPRALMTSWLNGEALPEGFALGDECVLKDPADTHATWTGKAADLSSDEVREHLQAGKQAFRLAITYEDRISFVLGDDLVIRKLKFLDAVQEQLAQDECEDARAELDATFALMSGELARLLSRLEAELSLSKVEA